MFSLGLLENNYKDFCDFTKLDISEKQFREYISKIKWIKNIYFMTATNKLIKIYIFLCFRSITN